MAAMVRMKNRDHETLKELAEVTGESMSDLIGRAVEELRRKHFLYGLADDFAGLRVRERAWAEEREERKAWDSALGDDLEDE